MQIIRPVESLEQRFTSAGIDNARRVAEELIAHVLGCKPLGIYLRRDPLTAAELHEVETLALRVENGEPLQYVIGHVDFRGLKIKCDPRALIPRPETELLVEEVLDSVIWQKAGHDRAPAGLAEVRASPPVTMQAESRLGDPFLPPTKPRIIDVGTGTGCIILALAQQHPEAHFLAVDLSSAALELARENARFHGLEDRIQWHENHLLNGFARESCEAVVANLPYIASSEWRSLSPSVRDHEPSSALDSGPSGMELIEALAVQARTVLVPGGMLFLEFGFDQGPRVFKCLERCGYRGIRIRQDLAGLDRIARAGNPSC